MANMRVSCIILVEKLEGTSQLGKSRYRYYDNIRSSLKETGFEVADRTELAHGGTSFEPFSIR
jgi:hypothetical protein